MNVCKQHRREKKVAKQIPERGDARWPMHFRSATAHRPYSQIEYYFYLMQVLMLAGASELQNICSCFHDSHFSLSCSFAVFTFDRFIIRLFFSLAVYLLAVYSWITMQTCIRWQDARTAQSKRLKMVYEILISTKWVVCSVHTIQARLHTMAVSTVKKRLASNSFTWIWSFPSKEIEL